MKKFLSLALALVMMLSLFACGGGNAENSNPPADDKTNPPDDQGQEETVNYKDVTHDSSEIYDMVLGEFHEAYAAALAEENVSTHFALMAIAEAKLLEAGVFTPSSSKGGLMGISRVAPYGTSPCLWGTDADRYYRYLVLGSDADGKANPLLKDAERVEMKEYWNEHHGDGTYLAWAEQYLLDKGYTLKDTYSIGYTSDPQTYDVHATYRAADFEVLVNTYDGLMEYNEENVQVPALAESYEVSEDELTYTFHIRQGAVWTDSQGREIAPVTADDWVAGLQHIMDNPGNTEYLVDGIIAGVSDYLEGNTTDMANVGVKALDDYTLEYTLEKPVSYFMTMLGYNVFAPLCRTYYESQGGTFGADADPGTYGTSPDNIAYCGAYLITSHTDKNSFVFKASDKYWNKDAVKIKTLNWYYNDGTDVMKSYNDFIAGVTDSCALNDSNMQQCVADGNYDDYYYISATDATSYVIWTNVNRGGYEEVDGEEVLFGFANYNDMTKAVSEQSEEERERTHAAMLNQNFRLAVSVGIDRAAFNAQTVGEAVKEKSLINSYVPGDFVQLAEDVTVDINGTSKTYPAGTNYGVIMQDQIDADGIKVKVYDPDGNDGAGSSAGFDGWYSPANCKAYLDAAVAELAEQGLEISAENPIQLDLTYMSNSELYTNRANSLKQSLEASSGGLIQVNLVACADATEWYYATYYPDTGARMNGNLNDDSGWGPDYGDPATYLDTLYADGDGSMLKCLGLF